MDMTLKELGYREIQEEWRAEHNLTNFEVGRVVSEHKERYIVWTGKGEYTAEITGNMRFTAQSRKDYPAVGDWVALLTYDPDQAIIHAIFPRHSMITRQAVGQRGEIQIIAANVDGAFLVQAVDRDFNINRLERYLTICRSSGIRPFIVLTKTDLIEAPQLANIIDHICERIQNVAVIAISNETHDGYASLKSIMEKGRAYCMLGSSGVGKSTLLNNLSGRAVMKTDAISVSTQKGRHVTTHRELVVLENGSILIDNPGMREVGIADNTGGLETTFDRIVSLATECKYKDCTHTGEDGCAVLDAVQNGSLDRSSYENFIKMQREQAHFESTVAERRKKGKDLAKILKDYKKQMGRNTKKDR
jgi:ribosome biogenesis GTPase